MEFSRKKIVITGIGTQSALGSNLSDVAKSLAGAPTFAEAQNNEFHQWASPIPVFAQASFDPEVVLGKKGLRTKDWATKLLLGGIELGFKELFEQTPVADRPGLCVGTTFGSIQSIGDFLSDSIVNGVNSVNPQAFANTVTNAPISNANIRYGVRSLSATVSTGFNASHDALLYGCDYLQRGYDDWIITGGFDEVSYYGLLGFHRSGVLSKSGRMQPFGVAADGFVAGEGCAMFLLETEEHAISRGATIIAEISGLVSAFDPSIDPLSNSYSTAVLSRVIGETLEMAGIQKSDLAFVAASAQGSPKLDALEASVLAAQLPEVPVTAYKSRFGECYGASGALSLVCAISDLQEGVVSATFGDYQALPNLNLVQKTRPIGSQKSILINSISCDGYVSSLVVKQYV